MTPGGRRTRPAAPRGTAGSQGAPPASGSRCSSEAPNRNGKDRRKRERHAQRSHPRPAGDEGFRAGGWVGLIGNNPQLAKLALDEALAAGALLLGRRSYEWLAARWPSRSGELADRLNSLPKYVVSATLANPAWNNSTVLKGDVLNEVSTMKQHIDGDIVIAGSFQLVRTLIEHDLVDELRLKIFPVALGVGERLFGETSDKKPMRLLDTQTLEGGIAYLTYQSVRDA